MTIDIKPRSRRPPKDDNTASLARTLEVAGYFEIGAIITAADVSIMQGSTRGRRARAQQERRPT
jgi:hypothetical protein